MTSFHIPDELAAEVERRGLSVDTVAREALAKAVHDAEVFTLPAAHDDTRFIAGMLVRGLSAEQVAELVVVLQRLEE